MKKTSILIPQQIPDFVYELYSTDNGELLFVLFLQAYYEWMEEEKGTEYLIQNAEKLFDVDEVFNNSSLAEFRKFFFSKFLHGIPQNIFGDKKLFIKHSKEFFLNKGNVASFKFLFKILFNEEIDFFIPHTKVLTTSSKEKGKLSEDFKIHDSNFWQKFSYEIISEKIVSEYQDIITKILHPAGFKMFGRFVAEVEETKKTKALVTIIENIINIVISLNRLLFNKTEIDIVLEFLDIQTNKSISYFSNLSRIPASEIIYGSSSTIQAVQNENLFDMNMLRWSENFAQSVWENQTGNTIVANFDLDPFNQTSTASRITNATGAGRFVRQITQLLANRTYVFSVWLRSRSRVPLKLNLKFFVSATNTQMQEITIDGIWRRYSFTFTPIESSSSAFVFIENHTDEFSASHEYLVWGAQLNRDILIPYVRTEQFTSSRMNLLINSSDVAHISWIKTNINVTKTNTFEQFLEGNTSTNTVYEFTQRINSINFGGQYTFSGYFQRQGTARWLRIAYADVVCWFDLELGALGTQTNCTGTIVNVAGYFFCTVTSSNTITTRTTLSIRSVGANGGTTKTGVLTSGYRYYGLQFFLKSVNQRAEVDFIRSNTFVNSKDNLIKLNLKVNGLNFETDFLNDYTLKVKDARENLLLQSNTFTNAIWVKTNLTLIANNTTAPDGTMTATRITCNSATSSQNASQQLETTTTGSSDYYLGSVFVRAGSLSEVMLTIIESSGPAHIRYVFNVSNGTVTFRNDSGDISTRWINHGFRIKRVGLTNWYQCSVFGECLRDNSIKTFAIHPSENGGSFVSGDGSKHLFIWGAQFTRSRNKESYIETTTEPYVSNLYLGGNIVKFVNNRNFITIYLNSFLSYPLDNTMEYMIIKPEKIMLGNVQHAESNSIVLDRIEKNINSRNLLPLSNSIENVNWLKTNVTVTPFVTSVAGDILANTIFETIANGQHFISQNFANFQIGRIYNFSTFVRSEGVNLINFSVSVNGVDRNFNINITTGAIISSSPEIFNVRVENFWNNWRRISFSHTVGSGTTDLRMKIAALNDVGATVYVGITSRGISVWKSVICENSEIYNSELNNKREIEIILGRGFGQKRTILGYLGDDNIKQEYYQNFNSINNLALLNTGWSIFPDYTSVYKIINPEAETFSYFDHNLLEKEVFSNLKKRRFSGMIETNTHK